MTQNEKLINLYNSGQYDLCYQLMDGLGIEYLDLNINYSKIRSHLILKVRSFAHMYIFYNESFKNITLTSGNSEELDKWDRTGDILKSMNAMHLYTYLITDILGNAVLSLETPKEELYKLLFKKL